MIRLTALAALAMCIAGPVGAQTPVRDAGAPAAVPSGKGTLSGVVVDTDKKPIRRATVSIRGDMRVNRSTITDDAGRFNFAELPSGRFTISAKKPGYPPMAYGAKRPFRPGSGVLLTEGQQVTALVLQLARGGVLTGTVFDERGEPMPGVPVMAYEVRTSLSGERVFDAPQTGGEWVTTDDRGNYRIFGLPPGEYTVGTAWIFGPTSIDARRPSDAEIRAAFQAVVQPAGNMPTRPAPPPPMAEARFNYAPVFHPSSLDPLAASLVALSAGEELDGIDIHMQFRQMSRIEGVVLGSEGPVAQARMALYRRSRIQALNVNSFWPSKSDGTFTTSSLSPGDFTVMAETPAAPGKPAQWASRDVTISGPEPIKVTLTLQPGITLTGHFVFDGTTLKPPADLARIRVGLFAHEGTSAPNSMVPSTDASGNFSIIGVTPGRFRVNVALPANAAPGEPTWSVRSVVADGQDVTDLPFEIVPGVGPDVTVTFTDQVSELSGVLSLPSGEPASDYFVIVVPADRRFWTGGSRRIVSARPDSKGRYVFRGLPQGEYRIAVTTDLIPRDLSDTTALEQLLAQSASVTIALGEKRTFDIRVGR